MEPQLSDEVKKCLEEKDVIYDKHFNERQVERKLEDINEIKAALDGEVIEFMFRKNNGQHYLIFAKQGEKIVHIVLMYNDGTLLLKTIYEPNKEKKEFENDLKTRLNGNLLKPTKEK